MSSLTAPLCWVPVWLQWESRGYISPQTCMGESLCKLCLLVGYVFICLWFPSSWVSWIWANPEISKQNTTETPSGFTSKQHFPGNPLPELESPLQPATAHCHWHQYKVPGLVVFCTHRSSANIQKHKAQGQLSKTGLNKLNNIEQSLDCNFYTFLCFLCLILWE